MVCSFEGCDHKRVARGLCMGHYPPATTREAANPAQRTTRPPRGRATSTLRATHARDVFVRGMRTREQREGPLCGA